MQKKSVRNYGGGKNRPIPREKWLVAGNHHEPIIDKETFEKVQEKRGKRRKPQHNPRHPLTGKLVCGCCKKNLQYRRGLNPYFFCGQRYPNAMKNCARRVNAMFMEQYVLFMMQSRMKPREQSLVLGKEMLNDYIDKIVVYDEQDIEIIWKREGKREENGKMRGRERKNERKRTEK